ncbi:MAG: hypothetical protein JJE09_13725 [Bacteroidia bacterium]|nr:hypothetical protein [Bacteroidia bacterium]
MINRYAGEIHINPIPILRNNDFNNNGHIDDIGATLREAMDVNKQINERLKGLKAWVIAGRFSATVNFHFAEEGFIRVQGLSDATLLDLNTKGLISLFDFATDKSWVKKYGSQFGLVWEDGRAIEI